MSDVAAPVVVTYRDEYREHFAALNREWIERWFRMEPRDWEALGDPRGTIVDRGGEVFFLLGDGEVYGTCALKLHEPGVYELTKMAVHPDARGRGYGGVLLRAALDAARERGARRVFLLSSQRLEPAIAMYRKHGFVVTRLGPHPLYERSDIEMELELGAAPPPDAVEPLAAGSAG